MNFLLYDILFEIKGYMTIFKKKHLLNMSSRTLRSILKNIILSNRKRF